MTRRILLVGVLVLVFGAGVLGAPTRQPPGGTAGSPSSPVDVFASVVSAKTIALTQGTITASAPSLSGTSTWNAGGVTFVATLLNVTDTASAAASLLAQYQVGGANRLTLRKDGLLTVAGNVVLATGGTINTHTVPSGTDTFTLNTATQTLTNKTLTSPAITGGTISSATLSSPTITGTVVGISAVLNAATATVDVVNTVTETDLYNFTVPANTLGTSNSLRFMLIGDYLNNSGAGATLQVRTYFGATLWLSGGARTTAAAANRKLFMVVIDLHAKGATNAQVALAQWNVSDDGTTGGIGTWQVNANSAGVTLPNIGATTSLALDSTATQAFRVSVIHSVAHANISVRLLSARLEILR